MKAFSLFTVLLLLSIASFSQTCDECSRPHIALYDCDVQVARPTVDTEIIAWYNLFWPSAVARSTMHNSDPTKDCIVWLDGALINARELQGGVFKFGQEYANLPPSGPIYSCDYLIRSTVAGSEGSYVFTLILEAGPSREVVKSVVIPFDATTESSDEAGRQAASQMMPLFQKIRKFEINKRNNDVTVAMRDLERESTLLIKPQKQQVDAGEIIDIDVTLTDCDGVPLSNRSIIFKDTTIHFKDNISEVRLTGPTGGEITPRVAITDGSGNVKVQFKAGDVAGAGMIIGYYPYYKPCGKNGIMDGTAIVQIKSLPPRYWLLEANLSETYTNNSDTTINADMGGLSWINENNVSITQKSRGKIIALIENKAQDPTKDFWYNSDDTEPLSILVSGEGFRDELSKFRETIDGKLISSGVYNNNVSGYAEPQAGIQFEYSDDNNYVGIGISVVASGSNKRQQFDGEWKDFVYDVNNYIINCSGGADELDFHGFKITKSETGYHASWNFEKHYKKRIEGSLGGVNNIIKEGFMDVTLKPLKSAPKTK
jgi:hypothetical protein